MIHVENLTKYYDDFCAVDQISLDIQKGEILGLLGPNGAGKTTTLRMLTGFFKPSKGNIRVKNFNIHENTLEIKTLIGYLPESAPIYQDMLVYDYLDFIANIRGIKKDHKFKRIKELTRLCGLQNIMHKSIRELSKGLKQRVGLAYAMMSDPEILILDEPTSGLDPNQIVEIRNIIKEIGRKKTIILSTHILSEAEATCDRIVIIKKGKIVADGTTESIKRSATKDNIIKLLIKNADFSSVERELGAIEGVKQIKLINSSESDLLKIQILSNPEADLRELIYHKIKETDWIILGLNQEEITLENIFRELTREN